MRARRRPRCRRAQSPQSKGCASERCGCPSTPPSAAVGSGELRGRGRAALWWTRVLRFRFAFTCQKCTFKWIFEVSASRSRSAALLAAGESSPVQSRPARCAGAHVEFVVAWAAQGPCLALG